MAAPRFGGNSTIGDYSTIPTTTNTKQASTCTILRSWSGSGRDSRRSAEIERETDNFLTNQSSVRRSVTTAAKYRLTTEKKPQPAIGLL